MAGGRKAVFRSQEGAEDDAGEGARSARSLKAGDAAVGIAASGLTPFVLGALEQARRRGARTILVTANRRPSLAAVDVVISPRTGPEALSGSTRMKSATAAKMVLNMLTTATMLRLGKIYQNWMVDLKPTSKKLHLRAIRLVSCIGGISLGHAQELLTKTRGNPKLAIVMARRKTDLAQARRLLRKNDGFLRPILDS
jgi:N-acetylmuramic acid 6-phosphate etherase